MVGDVSSILHAAAAGQASWLEAVDSISKRMQAAGAALMLHHGSPMTKLISVGASTIDPVFHQVYLDRFIDISPLRRFVQQGNLDRIFTGEEVLGHRYRNTDFHRDFLRPFKLGHQMVQVLSVDAAVSSSIVFYRTAQQGEFEQADRDLFGSLTVPLRNALNVHVRLSRAERAAHASAQAVGTQGLGVFLVNRDLEVQQTNDIGERQQRRHGLFSRSWLMGPIGYQLKRVLAEALATGRPADGLCRGEGNKVLIARIIPLMSGPEAAATILMREPEVSRKRPWKAIQSCFDLTEAEVRVLKAMVDEDWPAGEIAARLNISAHTLKSQRYSAYQKMGVSNQTELFRLLEGFSF